MTDKNQEPVSFYSEEGLKGQLVIDPEIGAKLAITNPEGIVIGHTVCKSEEERLRAKFVEDVFCILRELAQKEGKKRGEFSFGYQEALVEVHNYVWNLLDDKEESKSE